MSKINFFIIQRRWTSFIKNLNEQEADKVRKNMVLAFGLKLISKK